MTSASPSTASALNAVTCSSTMGCVAVGYFPAATLVERFVNPVPDHTTFDCRLRSVANGKFVSAEIGYTGPTNGVLRARASVPGAWELFRCVAVGTNQWAIRSVANGRYVSAELGYPGVLTGVLRARAISVGAWETFTFVAGSACSCVGLAVAAGKFVSAELADPGALSGVLRARAVAVGPWESFTVTPA